MKLSTLRYIGIAGAVLAFIGALCALSLGGFATSGTGMVVTFGMAAMLAAGIGFVGALYVSSKPQLAAALTGGASVVGIVLVYSMIPVLALGYAPGAILLALVALLGFHSSKDKSEGVRIIGVIGAVSAFAGALGAFWLLDAIYVGDPDSWVDDPKSAIFGIGAMVAAATGLIGAFHATSRPKFAAILMTGAAIAGILLVGVILPKLALGYAPGAILMALAAKFALHSRNENGAPGINAD